MRHALRGFHAGIVFDGAGSAGHLIQDNVVERGTRIGLVVSAAGGTIRPPQPDRRYRRLDGDRR